MLGLTWIARDTWKRDIIDYPHYFAIHRLTFVVRRLPITARRGNSVPVRYVVCAALYLPKAPALDLWTLPTQIAVLHPEPKGKGKKL